MKKLFITVIAALCCHLTAPAGDIFVSPTTGNDKAAGTLEAPLKTLEQALKQAREWRRLGSKNADGGINIILDGGVYRLYKPLFIRPEDSGTADSPTIIRSADGQQTVISGGTVVTGWRRGSDDERLPAQVRDKVWVADAPMAGNRMVETRQLWAGGRKAVRASQFADGVMERMKAFDTTDESITIPTPKTDLSRARQLEMVVHQRWAIAILRVREIKDMGNGLSKVWFHQPESQIEFAHPWPQPVIDGERGSSSFFLTNALELLDEPGEWYQDYPSGRIYYYPEDGNDPNTMDITVPVLETLVTIGGTRERHVSNIRFENVAFEHSAWRRPLYEGHVTLQGGFRFIDGYKLAEPGLFHKAELENQAWIARPEAAVTAQFADSIGFGSCTFSHTGATAVDLAYAVSSSDITGCTFTDIGGTAIMAGQPFYHFPYRAVVQQHHIILPTNIFEHIDLLHGSSAFAYSNQLIRSQCRFSVTRFCLDFDLSLYQNNRGFSVFLIGTDIKLRPQHLYFKLFCLDDERTRRVFSNIQIDLALYNNFTFVFGKQRRVNHTRTGIDIHLRPV